MILAWVVLPWHDALIDPIGFDPRSAYVEQFWLGILGPSTVWLLRRIASGFDHFYDAQDSAALTAAFNAIAGSVIKLSLSR